MSSLVNMVARNLQCTNGEAVRRIIGLFLILAATIAVVATVFVLLPYQGEKTEDISILPGERVVVWGDLDRGMFIQRDKFLEMAKGNIIHISLGSHAISYQVKADGTSYRYYQPVHLDRRYIVYDQEIRGDTVTYILRRDVISIVVMFTFFPVAALIVLLLLAQEVTTKEYGRNGRYYRSMFDSFEPETCYHATWLIRNYLG